MCVCFSFDLIEINEFNIIVFIHYSQKNNITKITTKITTTTTKTLCVYIIYIYIYTYIYIYKKYTFLHQNSHTKWLFFFMQQKKSLYSFLYTKSTKKRKILYLGSTYLTLFSMKLMKSIGKCYWSAHKEENSLEKRLVKIYIFYKFIYLICAGICVNFIIF